MESVKACIDEGVKRVHTARKLAATLGMHEATLALVRSGKRGLTPEQCGLLAALIDFDPCRLLALDAVEREKDEDARARLRERFFRAGTRGGAVACLIAATLCGTSGRAEAERGTTQRLSEVDKLYIVRSLWVRLLSTVQAWVYSRGQRLGPA